MKDFVVKTGVDLGSKAIKVVVTAENLQSSKVEVLGATKELSAGIVHGQVVSISDAAKSVKRALEKTEQALKLKIEKVAVGINTICTKHTLVRIRTTVAKASNEISDLDLEKSKQEAIRTIPMDSPFELLHTHIASISVDGKKIKGSVIGTIGHNLEIYYILTTIPKKSLENIIAVFEQLGLEIVEINNNAFVGSDAILEKRDKLFGIGILDIGGDNTSFTMYEHGYPVSVRTYALGGNTFNKDISVGLGVRMEEAETIKRNLKPSDPKKLFSIIDARIEDFVELVKRDIARSPVETQIANGIIISGGGANLYEIKEKIKIKLKIPISDAKDIISKQSHFVLKDASWVNAYASSLVNFREDSFFKATSRSIGQFLKKTFHRLAP